jgi:hypothetical protein
MSRKPWLTSKDLIESVKRKINFPISQDTFTENDVLKFANEEMAIAQVPSIMELHEEYFVYSLDVPVTADQKRYPIPDRAIGMKLRDLFVRDEAGNLTELYRTNPDDKAYHQNNLGSTTAKFKYYLEGNDVVLTQSVSPGIGKNLVFSFYLRPNQLVKNDRAAVVVRCVKFINDLGWDLGDQVVINGVTFTAAIATSTSLNEFNYTIGGSELVKVITAQGSFTATMVGNKIAIGVKKQFADISIVITGTGNSYVSTTEQGFQFDQLPETYLELDTGITEDLFLSDCLIDYLQTKPGHKTYSYDQPIPEIFDRTTAIVKYAIADTPENFIIGDYICLSNECIIPQIPPDLHNVLAERATARILAAQGDMISLQATNTKIQEMENRQGNIVLMGHHKRFLEKEPYFLIRHLILIQIRVEDNATI